MLGCQWSGQFSVCLRGSQFIGRDMQVDGPISIQWSNFGARGYSGSYLPPTKTEHALLNTPNGMWESRD